MISGTQDDEDTQSDEAEAEAVNRMLYLASAIGDAPVYIVHLSTIEGLEEIRQAKKRGQKHIGVETCPQYLLLTDDLYDDSSEGLKAVMAPPLRKPADNEALWDGLKDYLYYILRVCAKGKFPWNSL